MEPLCQVVSHPNPQPDNRQEYQPLFGKRTFSLDCETLAHDEILFQRPMVIKKSQSYVETDIEADLFIPHKTPISKCRSQDEIFADFLQRQQKERNRKIADKLSPVAKYKVQEFMRRNKLKGMQRRKFSLLMGIPTCRPAPSLQKFRQSMHKLAQDLDDQPVFYPPQPPPLLSLDDFMSSVPQINEISLSFDAEIELD